MPFSKPYRGFEFLSLRQQVLTAEKLPRLLPRNTQRCPYFVMFRPQSGLERTDCPGSNGVNLPAFLWTAHAQSGFSDFNGRMQRDAIFLVTVTQGCMK